jgi:hypothetical protein
MMDKISVLQLNIINNTLKDVVKKSQDSKEIESCKRILEINYKRLLTLLDAS